MKKVISLFLVMTLLVSVLAVSFNALSVSDVDPDTGEPYVMSFAEGIAAYEAENEMEPGSVSTQRIYFQMPNGQTGPAATDDVYVHVPDEIDPDTGEIITPAHDDLVLSAGEKAPTWYNDHNILNEKHYAGVYWWGGPADVDGKWVGYRMEIADEAQGIFYADIPYDPDSDAASVAVAIFNNGVDGGTDSSLPIYYKAAQTVDTNVQGAYPDDYDSLPYGSPDPWSFDNCIYVIDPDQVSINPFSQKQTCGANWYVYYGDGCYGAEYPEGFGDDSEYPDGTPDWSENVADICQNPDHFNAQGVHVGYQPSTDPTEPAPTEPEPTVHTHTPGAATQENVVPATCTAAGSYDEVIKCTECGEEISRTPKTIAKLAHTLSSVAEVPATETADGVMAHYECSVCHKLFSDASGANEVTAADLVIPATGGHVHTLKFKPGKKATETADGWKSYFYCTECGKYFNNANGDVELTWDQIVIPMLTPTEPPAPTDPPAPTQPPTEPPVSGFIGDVDGDGEINIVDVTFAQRILASIVPGDKAQRARGDVDKDGSLAATDVTYLQRWLLGGFNGNPYDNIGTKA